MGTNEGTEIGRATATGHQTILFVSKDFDIVSQQVAKGSDGSLWFATLDRQSSFDPKRARYTIGRITQGGVLTRFDLPDPTVPVQGITAGADGNF